MAAQQGLLVRLVRRVLRAPLVRVKPVLLVRKAPLVRVKSVLLVLLARMVWMGWGLPVRLVRLVRKVQMALAPRGRPVRNHLRILWGE